jgi:hypothetical protein
VTAYGLRFQQNGTAARTTRQLWPHASAPASPRQVQIVIGLSRRQMLYTLASHELIGVSDDVLTSLGRAA